MDATTSRYPEIYARWQRDPLGFWGEAADAIDWIEKPKTVFDPNAGVYGRWFPDGVCNTCYNAVDRHVEAGRGTQAAIIYDSPVTGTKQTITYAALQTKTETLAGILKHHFGVAEGRPRHPLHADGAGGAGRACWPARASARCIPWCSAASRRRSSPPASTTPSRR